MRRIISTWLHLDPVGQESCYPQIGKNSSDPAFQSIYWKCVVVFFMTSLRYNKDVEHILFSNTSEIPVIESFDVKSFLHGHNIEMITVENEYVTPENYYPSWKNQFFEFSIFKKMAGRLSQDDSFVLLDADCIFTRGIGWIFENLEQKGVLTYIIEYPVDGLINGITRLQMRELFNDFGFTISEPPLYSAGEVFCAKGGKVMEISSLFPDLWKKLLRRFDERKTKFNEEAHVLSFLYYMTNAPLDDLSGHIKRCWTLTSRNVARNDDTIDILHLPDEKKHAISDIFDMAKSGIDVSEWKEHEYNAFIKSILSPFRYLKIKFLKYLRILLKGVSRNAS